VSCFTDISDAEKDGVLALLESAVDVSDILETGGPSEVAACRPARTWHDGEPANVMPPEVNSLHAG